MKTILATTDFSEISENAVNYAAEVAKLWNAKLILFHGYSVPIPVSEVPVISIEFDELEKENMKLLNKLDAKLQAKYGKLETELLTKPGMVVDEILTLVKERKIDLVVMGITGAGKTAAILGSNTTTIIKKCKQPVIAVPANFKFKQPKKIALACDYKAIIPDRAVDKLKDIVTSFNAKLLIFDVLKKTELVSYTKAFAEVNLENALGELEHSVHFPSGDDLGHEVNEFVSKNHADMIAVMPHNYNFFEGLFHHSSAKKIALATHIPLLSIHE
jgi:nucleotide-binding universal stress UspA family protein